MRTTAWLLCSQKAPKQLPNPPPAPSPWGLGFQPHREAEGGRCPCSNLGIKPLFGVLAAAVGAVFLNALSGFFWGDGAQSLLAEPAESPSWAVGCTGGWDDAGSRSPADRKGPLTGRKGGAMEHNARGLLAGSDLQSLAAPQSSWEVPGGGDARDVGRLTLA